MAQGRPDGAEINAAGTIPAWNGGLTKPSPGFQPGGHYSDPFKADKILFTITQPMRNGTDQLSEAVA
jgi:hypothetical protein